MKIVANICKQESINRAKVLKNYYNYMQYAMTLTLAKCHIYIRALKYPQQETKSIIIV